MAVDFDSLIPQKIYDCFEYLKMIRKLFPRGKVWAFLIRKCDEYSQIPNSIFGILMSCFSTELSRFEDRIVDIQRESIPGCLPQNPPISSELLEDWERIAGLPETCAPLAGTTYQRMLDAFNKITRDYSGQNEQFYIDLALEFGTTITFSEVPDSFKRVGNIKEQTYFRVGQRIHSNNSKLWWNVEIATGDPNKTLLECLFAKLKPAEIILTFLDI